MKRRNFLKTIVGVVGAVATRLKITSAATPAPIPAPAPPLLESLGFRVIEDTECDMDRVYIFCTRAQAEAYRRLGYNFGRSEIDEAS